jgi:Zn-dependent membrane protease YugP
MDDAELEELADGDEADGSEQPARAATTSPADSAAMALLVLIRMVLVFRSSRMLEAAAVPPPGSGSL